jgi:hypothetical protein
MLASGQPYTKVMPDVRYEEVEVEQDDGTTLKGLKVEHCFAVRGFTYEESLQPVEEEDKDADPVYKLDWLEHDLGQQPTLVEAHQAAAEWRESLRGVYEIR